MASPTTPRPHTPQSLYLSRFVPLSVDAIDLMRKDGLPLCSFALPLAILSFMVLQSKHFAKQFVLSGGISAIKACGTLTRPPARRLRAQVARWEKQSTRARNLVGHQFQLLSAQQRLLQRQAQPVYADSMLSSEQLFQALLCNNAASTLGDSGSHSVGIRNATIRDAMTGLIRDSLNTLSFIARQNKAYYARIASAELECELRLLCWDTDNIVRGKLCNLLGNLCKHSDECYPMLARTMPAVFVKEKKEGDEEEEEEEEEEDCRLGDAKAVRGRTLIAHLSMLLRDDDPATRKFAAFAVGNAAFHSDALYPHLRVTVPALVDALRYDEIHKTRANAAGALGNLVRNSPMLCSSLVQANAPEALLRVALRDSDLQPQRIALFSLGNLCVYSACRRVLLTGGADDMMAHLDRLEHSIGDNTAEKYIQRIRSKLTKPGFTQKKSSGRGAR